MSVLGALGLGSVIGTSTPVGTPSLNVGADLSTLGLNSDAIINLSLGSGSGTSEPTSTGVAATVDLGLDLGTGSTTTDGGLLGGLFGGGTGNGGTSLPIGGTAGLGQTIIDLTGSLLGGNGAGTGGNGGTGGSGGTGTTPYNPGSPGQVINGTNAADTIHGSSGNDTINGLGGNDLIFGHGGNDVVDGGAGLDTFVATGPITVYNAAAQNGVLAIQNRSTGEMDFLGNIERIQFTDNKVLALDFNGDAGQAFRLYQAALNRAPEAQGLRAHVTFLDQGNSLHDDAQGFLNSPEFALKYGPNLSDGQFVETLYNNTLHRASEPAGYANWVTALASHTLDRASVLVGFSESLENHLQTDHQLQNGILLDYGVA